MGHEYQQCSIVVDGLAIANIHRLSQVYTNTTELLQVFNIVYCAYYTTSCVIDTTRAVLDVMWADHFEHIPQPLSCLHKHIKDIAVAWLTPMASHQ